ncbi:hypothetical protein M409DRAFT_23718 [Zasmidium cellare ATCC 36951]|uniref:F-box domain-containing protein n=1 Tax=Zasmidium cellare ATCC 36951 TaxID=1080233 RepID=A0A6A6CG05_ZASCE|nr:uncharacterized protein M409DRAFT_23718 [Zasmidium cellare ATCC 36951]KAF2165991.1 hypothetical protein M409DRAFT_23718 [Zasmidium cellare ATCC 36951]
MARTKKPPPNPLQNASSQTGSKFFTLPPELRNYIYELAFNDSRCAILSLYCNMEYNTPPGILTSCKVIYAEARQLYYTNCEFVSHDIRDLRRWLEKIGTGSRKSLRKFALLTDPYNQRLLGSTVFAKQVLCQLDHMLQAKDVTVEIGAMRVLVKENWWCWELDKEGKKRVVKLSRGV